MGKTGYADYRDLGSIVQTIESFAVKQLIPWVQQYARTELKYPLELDARKAKAVAEDIVAGVIGLSVPPERKLWPVFTQYYTRTASVQGKKIYEAARPEVRSVFIRLAKEKPALRKLLMPMIASLSRGKMARSQRWQTWFTEKPAFFSESPRGEGGTVEALYTHEQISKWFGPKERDVLNELVKSPRGFRSGPGQMFADPPIVEKRDRGWAISQDYGLDV